MGRLTSYIGPLYGADANTLSPLQSKVLSLLQGMRLDRPDVPACLVTVAAKISTLHRDNTKKGPTFVAIGHEAILWIQELVAPHISDPEFMESDAVVTALHSLRCLVEAKYAFRIEQKGTALWRTATTVAIALAKLIVGQLQQGNVDSSICMQLWTELMALAGGIVKANDMHLVDDWQKIYDDMLSDIASFAELRAILMPHLNTSVLGQDAFGTYATALFDASIIHRTEPGEVPGEVESPLQDLGSIRRGRVKDVPYSRREDMAYVCWRELLALSTQSNAVDQALKLSQAAAPLLVLRLAIPFRAYIADQPLRGMRPQPLSEQEELLFSVESIRGLKLMPNALSTATKQPSGEKAHLRYLYPLLVQALKVSQHRHSGSPEVFDPIQETLAGIDVFPS